AIRNVASRLASGPDEPVLVFNGDILTGLDIRAPVHPPPTTRAGRAPTHLPTPLGRNPRHEPSTGCLDRFGAAERLVAGVTVQRDRPRTPPQTGTPAKGPTGLPDGRRHRGAGHPSGGNFRTNPPTGARSQ
ncbi:hypothetical protein ACE14D_16520, partial [Streptomyces sp. Act-28]